LTAKTAARLVDAGEPEGEGEGDAAGGGEGAADGGGDGNVEGGGDSNGGGEGATDGGGAGGGGATTMDTVVDCEATGDVPTTSTPRAPPRSDSGWLTKLFEDASTLAAAEFGPEGMVSCREMMALAEVMLSWMMHEGS
jgi:hypothetical protein